MSSQSSPNVDPRNQPSVVEISDSKVKVPLPNWATTTIAVITIAGSLTTAILHLRGDKGNNAALTFAKVQATEDYKHRGEDPDEKIPVASLNGAEKVELNHYKSDGCILVVRSTPDGVRTSTLWVPRFNSDQMTPAPGAVGDVQHVESGSLPAWDLPPFAAVRADGIAYSTLSAVLLQTRPVQACTGHCTNPHPGQPATSYGQTNGCWVQVVRTWPDGCSQYQWYDSCHSVWDPKIYWTCCKD